MVNLRYVSSSNPNGTVYQFQATPFVKTRSANFHEYSWNPDVFQFDYGAQIKNFLKDAITYKSVLEIRGSVDQRRAWLDAFHLDCDLDIMMKTPGKLYWDDMYIECYILSTSTEPNEGNVTTSNEIGIYCPYPSWIYPVTYAKSGVFIASTVRNLLSELGDIGEIKIYSSLTGLFTPFVPVRAYTRAIYIGDDPTNTVDILIHGDNHYTDDIEIQFPGLTIAEDDAVVVDGRPGRKKAYLTHITGSPAYIPVTGTNIYNRRAANSHIFQYFVPLRTVPTGVFSLNRGSDNTILTVFLERSEPAWIS